MTTTTVTNKIIRSLSIGARPGFSLAAMVAKYNAATREARARFGTDDDAGRA